MLVFLLMAATALERDGWLPERMAEVVQDAQGWLEPLLREARVDLPQRPGEPQAEPARPGDGAAVAEALRLLDTIPVQPERSRGYDRDEWAHWLDADRDCQDARYEVLAAESQDAVPTGAGGCRVLGGLWRDAYVGEAVRDPGELDVDHLVPLAEAHRSGGHAWSAEQRAAYANDLGDTRSDRRECVRQPLQGRPGT